MVLKKLLFIVSLLYLLIACKEKVAYQVELKLSNLEAKTCYAVFEAPDGKWVDTIACESEEPLSIIQKDGKYTTLTIYFENHKDWITVYLEPNKKITVKGDALYPDLVQIKGTRTNELLSDFRKKASSLLKEKTELSGALDTMTRIEAEKESAEHIARLANIDYEISSMAKRFIVKHPNDEASAILIAEYIFDPEDPVSAEELINTLNPKLNNSHVIKKLKNYCEKAKQTMVGAQAPDFTMKNIYGVSYTLKSFTNKYIVLAFTATCCDICLIEDIISDKSIADFRTEDVEIMAVSLDENPQAVRDSLKYDAIRRNVFTDSAGQAIDLLNLYNVNSLPRCFLIDKKGTIILKTDNSIELKKTLEKLKTDSE